MESHCVVDKTTSADCIVDLSARSLPEAFEMAARALAEVTVHPSRVEESIARHIVLDAPTLEHLLFDWLSGLVDLKDRDAEIYAHTVVRVSGCGPCRLTARLYGGRILTGSTGRSDVKGVSPHPFVLQPCDGGWHVRFVVDL